MTPDPITEPLRYQSGFGNQFATESVPGALPQGRNSPQKAPFLPYPELVSGSAFTALRHENRRTWLYRRQPSVVSGRYRPYAHDGWTTGAAGGHPAPTDSVDGLRTVAANGDVEAQTGMAALVYTANRSMERRALVDADGELLLIPQQGRLVLTTEMGVLEVAPGEVALVPRGVAFKVALPDGPPRGHACENYGAAFRLPELGPIGSNGLANPRDFLAPVAAAEGLPGDYEIVKKYGGRLWTAPQTHTPFNVVAWHGNLTP
ncbi:hypothetical protein AVHM3334_05370 [Acidovorax sp. SUPP3334]|nr:hypothetical protein AVHM3334_05370 [Acidovorax sp. SUPP3334]